MIRIRNTGSLGIYPTIFRCCHIFCAFFPCLLSVIYINVFFINIIRTIFNVKIWLLIKYLQIQEFLIVVQDGKLIQKLMIDDKKCYLFGRNPQLNDFCIGKKNNHHNIYNYLFTYLTICLICCHTCFNTKLLNGEMVSILFFGTRCGPGLVNKTDKKSLIKKTFLVNCFYALICSSLSIMVPVLEYMLLLSVLYSRSWFLFSSTCCSYLFSILDHGSCSRVHAALICSLL